MANKRLYNDRQLTAAEKSRRHADKVASIDEQLDEAFSRIDWERRHNAEKSLVSWVNTYCLGLLLDDSPPERGCQVLSEMQNAVDAHNNYMILMSRGSGKSSYIECTTLYALALAIQKFVVIISHDARQAGNMMQDLWRMISEPDTPFAQDYPNICLPFTIANGSFRRRQMYKGIPTDISKNAQQIVLARLKDPDGNDYPTSGSIITVRGIGSGLRGMKRGTLRPSLVLLDDLQDSETAENPESVEKLLNIIRKDIMCLGGKQRLSILQTATPICPDDLVDHIKSDSNWKTQVFPAIIQYPKAESLWKEYFSLYDQENVAASGHNGSLEFYKAHQRQMDDGAEVFNPTRYSQKDGHISAIQKLLELKHIIGDSAFAAEYQMQPLKYSFQLDITPKTVVSRMNQYEHLEVPDGFTFVAASTDLNVSHYFCTTIVAFKRDMTAIVIDHFLTKSKIDMKLTDTEYNQQVYDYLVEIGKHLKSLNIKIDGWGIDANGKPFDAVTAFCKNSMMLCGVSACSMIGKASHMFSGFVRSRLRDELNRTVLCGDQAEHIKSGTGKKYMFWDSDLYRETVQKAFISNVGAPGSCSLYKASLDEHTEYAMQLCNEKIKFVKHLQDGRNQYFWKTAEPHDFLDSTAQAFAVAASQGVSSTTVVNVIKPRVVHKPVSRPIRRLKII